MAKFDLKKAILENKATFFGSLNEGQFSWFTQDTDQQIGSEPENTLPFVYMHDNKGNKWLEKNYAGYGEFGGKDYYELLDQMNGGDGDRSRGIDLAFDKEAVEAGKVLFPALTVSATLPSYHSFNEAPKDDPNQSWYTPEYEDDYDQNDDDDYNRYGDENEDLDESKIEEAMDVAKDMTTQEAAGHAERFAKYMSDKEGKKFTVTAGSVEGPSFDLDLDGIEYDGGSYLILTNGDIVNMAISGNPVYANISMLNEEIKSKTKMKKSELKELIKSSIMKEMTLDIDNMEDAPESEVDFLAEVDAILAEADEFNTNKPARIDEFIDKLLNLIDEYHAELYLNDNFYDAIGTVVKIAREEAMNLNEADEEVAVDDTEVAVDGEENIDVDTTVEVDPNVKAVQDSLTQAQAAAQKLGDPKLTDQIGNTITFFTRAHVVDKGAVSEGVNEAKSLIFSFNYSADEDDVDYIQGLLKDARVDAIAQPGFESDETVIKAKNEVELHKAKKVIQANGFKIYKSVEEGDEMEEGKKEYYKDAEADDAEHINALEKDMKNDKDSSMKIKEVVFPMWTKLNK